ncbi:transcription factor IBH1-like 1 [Beta vulgaris subsp. vulgaris]|uniref:transcription factor IBH1-like 1 n=1 Tax=Beta vulgaris subsp. vulgaris TaxID=3555 RepID=UPI0020372913|nr:transcription factor IBH1-like 1 [Beta vulgaris subsp. vulgaris]
MQNDKSLKKEFFKKWIMGLQICRSSKEKMSLLERKKAIKLSADLAMASIRKGKRSWSRAFINKASKDSETRSLAKKILGDNESDECFSSQETTLLITKHKITRMNIIGSNYYKKCTSKKICKYGPRQCGESISYKMRAKSMAKRLVKKRTQILKGLVPGGEYMDEYSLINETLDYIVSLQAQVDVMHHIANSPQLFIHN